MVDPSSPLFSLGPRPMPFLERAQPYRVPRHPAPVDLVLDGNEGLRSPPEVFAALAEADPEVLRRYPHTGALEAQLAALHGLSPEQVIVTGGGDDALDRACRATLGPGRNLILPAPTFEMIGRYARAAGAEVREVAWPEGPWPVEAVLDLVDEQTSAIAVVSPNNPTGAVASVIDLERLSRAAPHALLIVDLAYVEFADQDLTEYAARLPNALVFRTLSKAWGLAGLRVGYALGPEHLVGWLRAAGNPYPVAGPSLVVASRRLEEGAEAQAAFITRVREERQRLAGELSVLGARPIRGEGNFVFARDVDALWLRDAMAGLGIGIRAWPGREGLEDAVRITCPGDRDDFRRLRAGLRAALAPEAILFDMDGVLADVSRSYREVILRTGAELGAALSPEDVRAAKAKGDANNDWVLTWRLVQAKGVEASLEEVTERFEHLYWGDETTPGLWETEALIPERAFLEGLAEGRSLAVVTGRPRVDARRFLEREDLLDLFPVVVTMDDAALKPDPAPVHLALEALGVESAWMIGDTPDDARAARGAGVVPLGILPPGEPLPVPGGATTDPREILLRAGCARVLGTLRELEELLP